MAVGRESRPPLPRAFFCLISIPEYLFTDDSFRCFIEIRIQSGGEFRYSGHSVFSMNIRGARTTTVVWRWRGYRYGFSL